MWSCFIAVERKGGKVERGRMLAGFTDVLVFEENINIFLRGKGEGKKGERRGNESRKVRHLGIKLIWLVVSSVM